MLKKLNLKIVVNKKISIKKSAYTLLELSIVIAIMAVMMTGAIGISVSTFNNTKKIATEMKLRQLYNAVGKFLLINKRMPCPARLNLTINDNGYGEEVGNGSGCSGFTGVYQGANSNHFYGMIPMKSLGLPLEFSRDEYGSKISYIIDDRFTRSFQDVPNFSNPSFGTVGNYGVAFNIKEKPPSSGKLDSAGAIMIIMSHGKNKFGAFNDNSTTQNTAPTDLDELSNSYSANFDNNFIFKSPNSEIFDDIMIYKTRNQLVEEFNAFYLIACSDAGTIFGNKNAYYGQNLFGTCTNGIVPEIYCDKFGNWHLINGCTN
ncbi:MAG: type II secretion system protein [Rickettsiales bacterium]